ncbi:MAG: OmpH family outer membrane protein [Arenicella sp.]
MMKKNFWLIGCLLLSTMISNLSHAEELKVGYFNFLKVVNSVPQAKEAEKRLEAEFEPRKQKITQLDEEFKQSKADLEKNSLVMTEKDRDAKEKELRAKNRELKLLYQEYQEDLSLRQNQETSAIQKLVYQSVLEIAKNENYDLILDQGTVYASPKIDITAKVLEKLSKQ